MASAARLRPPPKVEGVPLSAAQVPFAYFHLLVLLNSAVLGMLAYGMVGMGDWFVTLAIYTLATLALMGLRELAVAMADQLV